MLLSFLTLCLGLIIIIICIYIVSLKAFTRSLYKKQKHIININTFILFPDDNVSGSISVCCQCSISYLHSEFLIEYLHLDLFQLTKMFSSF